jgi:hypothetical protein
VGQRSRMATIGLTMAGAVAIGGCIDAELDASREPSSRPPDGAIVVNFGYQREPLTRVRVVDLNTGDPTPTTTEAEDSELEPAPTAYLTRDLQSASREFPASQVTLGADARGPGVVSVSVSIDPRAPERVSGTGGPYLGEIAVSDGQGLVSTVPLWVNLANRNDVAWKAWAALLLGSLFGVFLKWLTRVAGEGGEDGVVEEQEGRGTGRGGSGEPR